MQQVNLYVKELRPKKVILSLSQMIMGSIALVVVLVGVSFYTEQKHTALKQTLASKQALSTQLEQQVASITERVNALKRDELLVASNKQLHKRVKGREHLVTLLDTVVADNTYRFSELMIGLARQRIEGLWLTELSFLAGGESLRLVGKTRDASYVPLYLQKLRNEHLFIGRDFDLFELDEDLEQSGVHHFSLSSQDGGDE